MEEILNKLTIEEKVGQMIIIGMDGTEITERIKNMIQDYKVGGVILYRKNFKTYEHLLNLVQALKDLNKNNKLPLFIAIDQEGGRVNRMPKEILNLPSANQIAISKDINLVKDAANITGKILRKSGFNMNFAPVLDIKRFNDNHPLGDRCFGNNVEDVSLYGIATMQELQKNGIISVIKHFPGHGSTKRDSHAMLPVTRQINCLRKEDMLVFKNAMNSGADAILVGHLLIKGYTRIFPTSLSRKFIVEIIRKECRYNGLVITDDLKMRAIKNIYGPMLAVRKAFDAGNDVVVFRYSKNEEKKAIEKIIELVKKNKIKLSRINRSVNRIIKIKNKYKLTDEFVKEKLNIENINLKIQEIRKKCE